LLVSESIATHIHINSETTLICVSSIMNSDIETTFGKKIIFQVCTFESNPFLLQYDFF
jgi:hypothetical protein